MTAERGGFAGEISGEVTRTGEPMLAMIRPPR